MWQLFWLKENNKCNVLNNTDHTPQQIDYCNYEQLNKYIKMALIWSF